MPELYTFETNPLGIRPVKKLLLSLAGPSIIANLFNALYNIVDQIFIGRKLGYIGNAATNISFPLTTLCLALGLLIGLGSAAGFNLSLGRRQNEYAREFAGNAVSIMIITGVLIMIIAQIFLRPLMYLFGATENTIGYTMDYARIIALGIPFQILSVGGNPVVRSDGSAVFSSTAVAAGAITNIILDYIFMYPLNMGIKGAAIATVIGQAVSSVMLLSYFRRFKSVRFSKRDFIPRPGRFVRICQLGFSVMIFQLSAMLIQIITNNLMRTYGAASPYGSDIPISVVGIVAKIMAIFIAVVIGLAQGAQPINSFNYGAKKYSRVRENFRFTAILASIFSICLYLAMQIFPREIIGLFGESNELYYEFAVKYIRGFTGFLFLNGFQTTIATFFTHIGKPGKGALLSMCKQLLLLLPLLLILSRIFGIDGIIYATPISDACNMILAGIFIFIEFRNMPKADMDDAEVQPGAGAN